MIARTLPVLALLSAAATAADPRFVLSSAAGAASVLVASGEPDFLRIAANDLVTDVRRISGKTLHVVERMEACAAGCMVLASATVPESRAWIDRLAPGAGAELSGKHEAFHIAVAGNHLLIAGSDPHGTQHGLYDFLENELGVDPMYLWTGRQPARRAELSWTGLRRKSQEPSFRHRGWFLNDEDLLTEWKDGGGPRDIDYPYYSQVTAPEVLDRVFETMLRMKFNLVIPASFTDLRNPAERRMVESAARRGLQVSMHHVEPMGVSAFAFANYWRARGREVEYSYVKNAEAFHEVWRHYAKLWAKYPGVVWQVGLRGIADRPVWFADKSAPADDAGRGAMISRAIAEQVKIIREVDRRPEPPITTTLWMEGAYLFRGGHLKIPREVIIVFADNNSGWKWQSDFFEVPRERGRGYGVYYHHAVWGQGPHLVQAVPPRRTHGMMREAWQRHGRSYAIFNVSNVREFVLGLAATSSMLWDFPSFDPDAFLDRWLEDRFGAERAKARRAYDLFFDSYVINETRKTPDLLDGIALHEGERLAGALLAGRPIQAARRSQDAIARSFPDVRPTGEEPPAALLVRVERQIRALDRALDAASEVNLTGEAEAFFRANLTGQARLLRGVCRWTAALAAAAVARDAARPAEARVQAKAALAAIEEIRSAQAGIAQGEFRDWYRGDRKMNLNRAEDLTRRLQEKF